jgi:hypothetical protein
MNTKLSPLVSGSITAMIAAVLAIGATIGALSLTGNLTFSTDNSSSVGSQSSRAAAVYTANLYADFASTTESRVGVSGTILDGFYMTTTSINPDSLTAWSTTSAVITVTGMVAQDWCSVANPYTASGTAIGATCLAGAGTATLTFRSATGATFNAEPAVFPIFGASKRP